MITGEGTPASDLDLVVIADPRKHLSGPPSWRKVGPWRCSRTPPPGIGDTWPATGPGGNRRWPTCALRAMCWWTHPWPLRSAGRRRSSWKGARNPFPRPSWTPGATPSPTSWMTCRVPAARPSDRPAALAWPNFVLAVHRQWGGQGKWALRQLRRFSPGLARDFAAALEECCSHNAGPLVELVDRTLEPLGGPSSATGHWGVASE
ncbi:MAG: hypothetical protein AB1445_01350 [Bacillota bacterium]